MKNPLDALKSLESFGYREKVVQIGDVKITLAPLTINEVIGIFERSTLLYQDDISSTLRIKIEVIAHAIIGVGETKLSSEGRVNDNVEIILRWGEELVEHLFLEYCELDQVLKSEMENRQKSLETSEDVV